jgi:hypothetical protein
VQRDEAGGDGEAGEGEDDAETGVAQHGEGETGGARAENNTCAGSES